jgi:WD40 repeat protein
VTEVVATPASPYKGLAPFEDSELDAAFFFGREREREIIAANLMAYRLTVLYGASGVGKSSVLRAGVMYQLRRLAFENKERLGHPQLAVAALSEWSGDPVAELLSEARSELVRVFGEEVVALPKGGLADSLETWCSELGCEVYLVLDQMDEYFLYHEDDDTFPREFAEAATRRGLRVNFLVSIREDMLAKLDQFKGRIPNLFSNYLRLDHLDREAARAAIEGPVSRYNELVEADLAVAIEPALVAAVLDQTVAGRVRLVDDEPAEERPQRPGRVEAPYLQLVMQRLWEEEHGAGSPTLRLSTLERLGGATQIVRTHLTAALAALSPAEQDLAETLFNYLVTPSGTKIAHGLGDLAQYAAVPEGSVLPVLSVLAHERIVRRVSEAGEPNGGRYEIYHDVLAEPVAAWRARHAADRQLAEERREAERRHRRMFVVTAISLVALAAMTLVAIFALAQRREAQNQRAEAQNQRGDAQGALLTSRAQAALSTDPAKSVEYAIRAAVLRPETPGVADVLRTTLIHMNARGLLPAGGGPVQAAEFGRRGSLVLVAGTREARVYRTGSHQPVQTIEAGSGLRSADLTPDGRFVVTIGSDGAARVWRVRTGKLVRSVHRGHVTSGSVSDDGRWLVTVSRDRAARIWELHGGRLVHEFHERLHARAAVLSPDDSRIVVITEGNAADLYDVATEAPIAHLDHPSLVRSATFDPHSRLLATTSGKVELLWDARTGAFLRTLKRPDIAHSNPIVSAAFSPDGKQIVTGDGADAAASVYDTSTGDLFTVLTGHVQAVTDASFSPAGDLIVTTSDDHSARIYRSTGGPVAELLGNGRELTGASWAPDGNALITASKGGIARLWDPNVTAEPRLLLLGTHSRPVTAVSFNSDGTLAVSAGADGKAQVWHIGHGLIGTLAHGRPVTDAAFAGNVVVTASEDGTARIWRPRGGAPLHTLRHGAPVHALGVGSTGRLIATGGSNGAVELWAKDGKRLWLKRQGGDITSAAFSPDGRLLVTSSTNGTARIWRVSDGRSLHVLKGHQGAVVQAAFSPNGRYIATAGEDSTARIWDVRAGKRLNRHLWGLGGPPLTSLAFNPSGTLLATASTRGGVRLLRVPSGELEHDLHPHVSVVSEIAFSHDGRWLVTAGPTRAAVLRASTGQRLLLLRGHKQPFTSVAFSPRGLRILTGGEDGSVRTYDCRLCSRLPGLIALGRERREGLRPRR